METHISRSVSRKKIVIQLAKVDNNAKEIISENTLPDQISMALNSTVKDLVNEIERISGFNTEQIQLFYDGELIRTNKLSLFSLLLSSDRIDDEQFGNMLSFTYQIHDEIDESIPFISLHGSPFVTESFRKALVACRIGFNQGLRPELALDGSGGTYFLFDKYRKKRLCFKPADEEPYNVNNPRSFQGPGNCIGIREGIRSGEGYKREIAAFLIDHSGFFNVPPTVQARIFHPSLNYLTNQQQPKIGSLQLFISSKDIVGNWGCSCFSVQQVQKVCILDIYLMNTDRNDANILLVQKNDEFVFIPIDHGYCLPDRPEINEYSWCWLYWPQVKKPWTKECIEFIRQIDIESDRSLLYNALGIRKICLLYMKYIHEDPADCYYNLTPFQVASIFVRKGLGDEEKSRLDLILEQSVAITYDFYQQMKASRRDLDMSPSNLMKEHNMCLSERHTLKKCKTINHIDKFHDNLFLSDVQESNSKKLLLEEIASNSTLRHLFFDNFRGFVKTLLYNIAKKDGNI